MAPYRSACTLVIGLLGGGAACAQHLSGTLDVRTAPAHIVLLDTRGAEHAPIDSAAVTAGRFDFAQLHLPAGFYQLAVNDTDRVDLILDPREAEVRIACSGVPLQEHITIVASEENRRMWAYKQVSRRSQARIQDLVRQRGDASPMDTRLLLRLDSTERAVRTEQQAELDQLIAQDPASYFSTVVRADRALMAAIPQGYTAIRDAFGWADPRLLHSAIYSKAVMALLQNVPSDRPDALERGCDSLLTWSAGCPPCWTYTRSLLVQLFEQYGPDHVAHHLVDTYVLGLGALVAPEPELLHITADLLRTTVGAQAPEVLLPDPLSGDTVRLATLLAKHRYTALFFYSSTCDHCHEQMPGLRALYAELHTRGLELVGIALDADTTEFKAALEAESIPWPSFSELNGWGSHAAKAFAVKATPSLFLLDPMGRIVARPADHVELRAALSGLLP